MKPLEGRGVLVTGASSGIGRAIAVAAARAGADVALTYRSNASGARETEAQIRALGQRAVTFQIDLADEAALASLGACARDGLGRLDAWINNAGADILTGAGASLSDVQKMDLLISVDLRGTILASWQAAERSCEATGRRRDHQYELGSRADRHGRNQPAALCRSQRRRARVQQVAGAIGGSARARQRARAGMDRDLVCRGSESDRRDAVVDSTPLARWGTPDDVAGAAVFLASPAAAFMTGQVLLVGGGVVM